MSLLEGLAQYLEDEGHGSYSPTGIGGTIFVAVMPASPDNVVSLYPTGGMQSDTKMGWDRPTIQVRVRGTRDPRPAMARLEGIYNLLHSAHNIVLPGGTFVWSIIGLQSAPVHIGLDSNERHEFVINFLFEVRNTSGNRE